MKLRVSCDCFHFIFVETTALQIADEKDWEIQKTIVTKTGRTTNETTGRLSENATFIVKHYGRNIKFKKCFQITHQGSRFSREGDSGSGVFLKVPEGHVKKALGILIGTDETSSLVCDVKKFLELCNLELVDPTG